MIDVHALLSIPYRAHGRDVAGCDCWGLVRLVRHMLRGQWLPSYADVAPGDHELMACTASEIIGGVGLVECAPTEGAVVSAWRGRLCLHAGIVIVTDGRLAVLDTTRATGPRWQRLPAFARGYSAVHYHD
jgi:hypothetical protein